LSLQLPPDGAANQTAVAGHINARVFCNFHDGRG
jgi:hypothetical protein